VDRHHSVVPADLGAVRSGSMDAGKMTERRRKR
jgi:hypothetical protein